VEAYDAYLRGRALIGQFDLPANLALMRKDFEQALRLDPNLVPALAGLALVECQYYRDVESDPARLHRAEALAQKALAIDPHVSDVHTALGQIAGRQYDYRRAAEEFQEARRLEPDNALDWDQVSWAQSHLRRSRFRSCPGLSGQEGVRPRSAVFPPDPGKTKASGNLPIFG
jgi:tetratricopeptide (TPR) repeat protein